MKIDFHTHHYPLAYLDELERHPSPACSVTRDPSGRRLVNYAGDFNVVADGHIDLETRLAEMDRTGVDKGVLSFTTPGVHVEERQRERRAEKQQNSLSSRRRFEHNPPQHVARRHYPDPGDERE